MKHELNRCSWASGSDELLIHHHDHEWGVPIHDDRLLFEMLILEGAQAGLSWITILRKRDAYKKAFDNFDPVKIARYSEKKLTALMENTGIVRNRLKIEAAVKNARAFLAIQKEFGSFDRYLWNFVSNAQVRNHPQKPGDVPARTELSDEISKDLKKRGMSFVGSTIIYAFLQSVGVVDDHVVTCFRSKASSR